MIAYAPSVAAFALAGAAQGWVAFDPLVHVLIQFPLLAAAGYLLPVRGTLPRHLIGPALVLALTATAVWMLPRSVDAALQDPVWHLAKFVSLPLGVGLPLAQTWGRIGPVLRGFLKAQAVSMLLFLGFLYTHAPVRICNSYLIDDQVRLGIGFGLAAGALALFWVLPAFTGTAPSSWKERHHDLSRVGN